MKGAREYAKLFKTGQYGKLYIVSSSHARGYTFRIQVLPEGEIAISNGNPNNCLNSDAVEVYAVIEGNTGWTESYGWLFEGKWQEDFYKLVRDRKEEISLKETKQEKESKIIETLREQKNLELLSKY